MPSMMEKVRSYARASYAASVLKIIKGRTSELAECEAKLCYLPTQSTFELRLEQLSSTEAKVELTHPCEPTWSTRVNFDDRRSVATFKERLSFQIERMGTAPRVEA